jgi:hypothetical protein
MTLAGCPSNAPLSLDSPCLDLLPAAVYVCDARSAGVPGACRRATSHQTLHRGHGAASSPGQMSRAQRLLTRTKAFTMLLHGQGRPGPRGQPCYG